MIDTDFEAFIDSSFSILCSFEERYAVLTEHVEISFKVFSRLLTLSAAILSDVPKLAIITCSSIVKP